MDDNWAAIVVSAITGVFGFLGVMVMQLAARAKVRKIKPSAEDILASSEGIQHLPRLDYLANMKNDLQEFMREEKTAHHEIGQQLSDIERLVRHGFEDTQRHINRLERD